MLNSANSFDQTTENHRHQISEVVDQLRQLTQQDVQTGWRSSLTNPAQVSDLLEQPLCELNAKHHIAWSKGREVIWLYQQFVLALYSRI